MDYRTLRYLILFALSITAVIFFQMKFRSNAQQFTWQARSFMHGRLDLQTSKHLDTVEVNNKLYWPEGPFPSVVLVPFIFIFGENVRQGHAQIFVVALLIFALFRYTRRKGFSAADSVFLTSSFIFGSVFSGIMTEPSSWYFAQIIAVFFLTCMLIEWESRRNYLLLGIYCGALIATRPTAALFGVYVCIYGLVNVIGKRLPFKNMIHFLLPVAVSIVLLGWFNWARFGTFFDSGYSSAAVVEQLNVLRKYGLFSIRHIPTNAYWYFLAGPVPVLAGGTQHIVFPFIRYNQWGMSLFLVSPFLFYSLRTLSMTSTYVRGLWIVVVSTLIVLVMYYATGWYTFGPRFTNDFLPVLYVLLLKAFKRRKLNEIQKNIILASAIFNTYLIWSTRFMV